MLFCFVFSSSLVLADQQSIELKKIALPNSASNFEIAFSPNQGATDLIVKTIRQAQKSIQVAAYAFTAKPIGQELIAAYKRGVEVKIVLDKSQQKDKHSLFSWMKANKVPVKINSRYAIMHNKFMIIDNKTLQLGSFNYSKAAEKKNAENVLVLNNIPEIVKEYAAQWQKLWDEAV